MTKRSRLDLTKIVLHLHGSRRLVVFGPGLAFIDLILVHGVHDNDLLGIGVDSSDALVCWFFEYPFCVCFKCSSLKVFVGLHLALSSPRLINEKCLSCLMRVHDVYSSLCFMICSSGMIEMINLMTRFQY